MPEELGKNYPCFGEYRCSRCGRKWQSAKAWADYGQQCQNCVIPVNAFNLQRLFVYICDRCNAKWKWAHIEQGMKCRQCSSSRFIRPLDPGKYEDRRYIQAHRLQELSDVEDDENHIDPSREHRQDLCEKCRRLGRPCRETAGQNDILASTRLRQRNVLSAIPTQQFVSAGSYRPYESSNTSRSTSSRTPLSTSVEGPESSDGGAFVCLIILLIFGIFVWYIIKS
ncbi:unnamed protein product [Adineta ricciae]|uniref:3CxxC-type domain-containing protein n=1 Tax=Adineta ricciae TaxID=249248 RepID=A0A815UJU3_ADIRI|nr:unnamed protein product [Adineta ricciae]CAF1520145.1 unnamed protein product [Adineta ricciae]